MSRILTKIKFTKKVNNILHKNKNKNNNKNISNHNKKLNKINNIKKKFKIRSKTINSTTMIIIKVNKMFNKNKKTLQIKIINNKNRNKKKKKMRHQKFRKLMLLHLTLIQELSKRINKINRLKMT
jgi:hypothetical protein